MPIILKSTRTSNGEQGHHAESVCKVQKYFSECTCINPCSAYLRRLQFQEAVGHFPTNALGLDNLCARCSAAAASGINREQRTEKNQVRFEITRKLKTSQVRSSHKGKRNNTNIDGCKISTHLYYIYEYIVQLYTNPFQAPTYTMRKKHLRPRIFPKC